MVYVSFGEEGSEVRVYSGAAGYERYLVCADCCLGPPGERGRHDFVTTDTPCMVAHLRKHQVAHGEDAVPEKAFTALLRRPWWPEEGGEVEHVQQ